MARKFLGGFEVQDTAIAGAGSFHPEISTVGGTVSIDTVLFRSGLASLKCDSTGSNTASFMGPPSNVVGSTSALDTLVSKTWFFRCYYNFTNLPSSTASICDCANNGAGGTTGVSARLTSAGKLELFNNVTGAQIGSDSAATLTTGQWYRVEGSITTNASSQITSVELRLDGVTVASASGLTIATNSVLNFGWETAPGASKIVNIDDVGVNDSTGSVNNSWLGDGHVVLLKPISDSAVGASWTDSGGASTNLWQSVKNTPPTGIADTTGSAGHQIRNAASASSSYDANLTSYATAGIGAGATINAVVPFVATGAPVVTGAKTGSFGIVSNPAIANIALLGNVATDFWTGTTAGTYHTGWKWTPGTITEAPAVTLATSPVARITITGGTAARIAMVTAMYLYVDYTPATSTGGFFPFM